MCPTISIVAYPSRTSAFAAFLGGSCALQIALIITVNTEHSATVLLDQSLSVHLGPGLPRLLLPTSLPSSISVHRFLALTTWPKYWSLRRCVSRRSCGCASCRRDALVRCPADPRQSSSQNLVFVFCPQPSVSRLHNHVHICPHKC